ncbi:MAG: TonB-dependent receptor [Bacteroidetes bacterium]|nr:TonB-dependent receptor [Bacteroidota bacterium]
MELISMSTSRIPLLILSAASLLLLNGTSYSQSRVAGIVRSAEDSSSIAGATVMLQSRGAAKTLRTGMLSGIDGSFAFDKIQAGTYRISVTMIGFRRYADTVSIRPGAAISLKIFLVPSPVQTAQVVITASKRRQLLTDVPVSVSLVSAASMERRNVISLDDALRYVPGVNFIQDQVNIRGSSGYARGIGSRVLLLIDGIPLLSGDTGQAIWESIPISEIDHVEVVKGAGSSLYGSSALGGVIDVITKNNVDVNSTDVKLYGGFYQQPTYSQWQWSSHPRYFQGASITHSQPIGLGDFGITASLSYKKDDGYIQNDSFRRLNLYAMTAGTVGRNQSLKVFGDIFNQYSGNFLYWEDIAHALQPSSSSLGQWVNSTRANLSGIYTHVLSDKFLYIVRGSYYFNHWYDNFGDTPTGIGDSSTSSTGYLEFQGNWNAGPSTILTFGADGQLDFIYSNSFTNKRSNSGAVYFQGEQKVNRLHVTAGARYDYEKIEGKSAFNQFNPKLGLVYDLGTEASLRASIGTGFRAPSIGETYASIQSGGVSIIPNPALLPERSLSEEIGGRFPIWYLGLIDAAVFQSDYWNMIEPEFNNTGQITFQNVTRARIQGYEIDASSDLGSDFATLKASYTYIYPLDLTTHDILKYRSRELFYVSADFYKSIYRASVDFRYISEFQNYDKQLVNLGIVRNGNDRVPAYVTDARVGVDLTSIGFPLDVSFIVNNVFNYYYVEMIGNMAPLRNFSLVLSTDF